MLFLFLFFASTVYVEAQQTTGHITRRNSPYSRFGMGDMFSTSFAPNLSMGGAFSATYQNVYDYNLDNAASLGSIETTSFETGLFYQRSRLREANTDKQQVSHDGNLNYMALAFPITRSWDAERDTIRKRLPLQWGMSISLMPHSTVGYDVRVVRNIENIGNVEYNYLGKGSRSRINWGNGWRYKGFSAGANVGIVFGKVNNEQRINFLEPAYNFAFNEERISEEYLRAFVWDAGLQYSLLLQERRHSRSKQNRDLLLVLGVYGSSGSNASIDGSQQLRRFGQFYSSDTLRDASDIEQTVRMPGHFGAGFSVVRKNSWRIGFNYEQRLWSQYQEQLVDAYKLSLGGEWSPSDEQASEKIRLRAGLFYGNDPRAFGSEQLQHYGITFGLGLPIIVNRMRPPGVAFVNLGLEWGYLGNRSLIEDSYIQLRLAVGIHDGGWFVRSKYR